MKCTLPSEIKTCQFNNNGKCTSNSKCSFQDKVIEESQKDYVRTERWYEKYYKK